MHPVLFLILLVTALVLFSWYKRLPASQKKKNLRWMLIAAGAGVLLLGLVTGRLHPLFAALAALVPVAGRVMQLVQLGHGLQGVRNAFKSAQGPSPGRTSEVNTEFLRMTLDHDSGEMEGEVTRGRHAGHRLADLNVEALVDLMRECEGADSQSVALLEAYLDRSHGQAWREAYERSFGGRSGADAATGGGPMSAEEAREILGVAAGASREETVDAHRRLMQKLHPDRGGSTYLAAKVNQAKDMLLSA